MKEVTNIHTGQHTQLNNTTEQAIIEDIFVNHDKYIHYAYIKLYANELTQDATFRVYEWVGDEETGSWAHYNGDLALAWSSASGPKIIRMCLDFHAHAKIRLTMQSASLEGADRNVDYQLAYSILPF